MRNKEMAEIRNNYFGSDFKLEDSKHSNNIDNQDAAGRVKIKATSIMKKK